MWRCPKCKGNVRIFGVRTSVIVYANGTEIDGDMEWDEGNEAECVSCDWEGTAGETQEELLEAH
jgi:hypothetical protein